MPDQDLDRLTDRLKRAHSREEQNRLWEDLIPNLRKIAANRIRAAGRNQDSPTELVNEMFPGLHRALLNPETQFESRGHFFAYAAQAMRHHLAASARKQLAEEINSAEFAVESASPALTIGLDDALDRLSKRFPRAVRAFELREYAGHSYDEILTLMSAEYRTKALIGADLTLVRKLLVEMLSARATS